MSYEYPDIKELWNQLEPMDKIRLQQFFEQHQDSPALCLDYAEYLWDAERTGVLLSTTKDGEPKTYLLRDLDEAKGSVSKFLVPGENILIEAKDGTPLYAMLWATAAELGTLKESGITGAWFPLDYGHR